METATDYVNAVLAAHPSVTTLHVPSDRLDQLELDELPSSVSVETWDMDYCQGNDDADNVVVIFRF